MPPHARAIRLPPISPAEAFARLVRRRGVFWLDSSLRRPGDGRFSVMGCDPEWEFTATAGAWRLDRTQQPSESGGSGALDVLDGLLNAGRVSAAPDAPHLPFFGGAVGWLSYDLGRQFEIIEGNAIDDLDTPDICVAWYDAALVWDHEEEVLWLVGTSAAQASGAMADLRRHLEDGPTAPAVSDPTPAKAEPLRSNLSRRDYLARVESVREGIARGEYYQLNLVQRFSGPRREEPAVTYLRLRDANPAPFAAYFASGERTILSSSPEQFLSVSPDGEIRTCPIKGTRPRGRDAGDDAARRGELLASEKERAELLMIVDLLRNDLGRVCVPGSIQVVRLHAVETFATVHHLVGEIRGRLRPDVTRRELLRAVFPGGSITGAPKVSAMRAIDRLEPHRRGIGMGSLGYFSAHGRIELNIAIRTIVCQDDQVHVPVGAGIVWDSDPAAEYAETLAKASALFAALGVETPHS